jgi:hypothetical protein
MAGDIRIKASFPRHPKTKRLRSLLGPAGVDALISLWCWASEFRPKGNLSGLTTREIEEGATWKGEPGAFISAIHECGFADCRNGTAPLPGMPVDNPVDNLFLHDWKFHNPYAYFSRERSVVAKRAANVRWKKDKGIAV